MTKARLSIRIPESLKTKIRKAAILTGHATMTDYIVNTINEHSTAFLNQHTPIATNSEPPKSIND